MLWEIMQSWTHVQVHSVQSLTTYYFSFETTFFKTSPFIFAQIYKNWPSKDNNNNNNEILIKREPLVYTRAQRAVQRKKRKRLGQYNSNNKPIHGQYTSRYNLHLSHSLSPPPPLSLTHMHTHTHNFIYSLKQKQVILHATIVDFCHQY